MLPYRDHLTITRPASSSGAATQDPVTGVLTPALVRAFVTLYSGAADIQDAPVLEFQGEAGARVHVADATAFLADESTVEIVRPGDMAHALFATGRVRTCEVTGVRGLDGVVLLRWRRPTEER